MESRFDAEEINLQKYFQVLQRRWLVMGGMFAACVGLAGLAASLQQPVYTAEGKLLFQLNRASSLLEVNSSLEELKSLNTKSSPLTTQAVILQSAPILEGAIARLNLRDDEGKLLEPSALVTSLTVEPLPGTDVLKVVFQSEDAEVAATVVNEIMQAYIASDILNNRTETRAAREFITSQLKPTQLEVDLAAEALRQFLDTHKIVSLQDESTRLVSLVGELDSRINTVRAQFRDVSAQAQELRQTSGLSTEQAIALNTLNKSKGVQDVLNQYQAVQEKLTAVGTTYRDDSPQVQKLQQEEEALRSLLNQRTQAILATGKLGTGELGAGPIGAADQIAPGLLQQGDLQQSLAAKLAQVEIERAGLDQQLQSLLEARATHRNQASRIPSLQKRQQELERRLKAAQGIYESLLKKLQEIRVAENQNMGNSRIIQQASVPRHASNKMQLMLLAGGTFVGLSLGIAAAFLADLLDRSVRTVSDAKLLFNQTLVGLIPQYTTVEPGSLGTGNGKRLSPRIMVASSPRSLVNESYQMLRANLKFMSAGRPLKSLVITSSVAGEGRSEVTANLAAAMAQVGRRVLIVDADMRTPSQHHLWGLANTVGLSNIIVGQERFENSVQSVSNRLSVLTAGLVPPNPSALIDSKQMTQLIEQLSKQYDYIIFDTPPLSGMPDAAILGTMVDGVLLVMQPGLVNIDSANVAKQLLERSSPNILGLVANGVDLKKNGDNPFHYRGDSGSGSASRSPERHRKDSLGSGKILGPKSKRRLMPSFMGSRRT